MENKTKKIDRSDIPPKSEKMGNPVDSPGAIAFIITLIVLLVLVPTKLILTRGELSGFLRLSTLVAVAVVIVVMYLIIRYMISRYVKTRLDAVDRIMNAATDSKRKRSISDVSDQVSEWARRKESEIETLKASETWRKEFLGNVSHELKTPIFNLQGLILTLLDGGLEDKTINRLYLERAEKSINRLISIVEDLQSISRLESEEDTLQKTQFSLRKLVQEVIEANEVRAAGKKVTLSIEASREPFIVTADRKRIFQVIANLVVNSVNYGNPGGKTKISLTSFGDKVLVEVTDDGVGIEDEHLPRIFERFYRVEKHRSRDSGGTGLGLAIVKHIVEAHGHTVMVKSKPGEGSTFSFTLSLEK